MNPNLQRLEAYPFAKLQKLFNDLTPPPDKSPIALSIGEPQHIPPPFVLKTIEDSLHRLANYPTTTGLPELRDAIAAWLRDLSKHDHDLVAGFIDAHGEDMKTFARKEASRHLG